MILKENHPIKSTLTVHDYDYYMYTVIPDPDILTLYFQLTPLTGDPDLFAARTMKEPGFANGWEKAACFCVNLLSFTYSEIQAVPQYNTIYLSVFGLSSTTYTINVLIERKFSVAPK